MNSLSGKSFNRKIAFASAFITSVSLAVVFKLCLEFTCQSLIYANAMLSTSFTLLVCLKMYEMQNIDDACNQYPLVVEQQLEVVAPQSMINRLSAIKDIQLSYVIPCIKTVINDMYDTFGWCVEPIYWLFEKYMQIVYPFDSQEAINDNARIEYVTEFCQSLTSAIDNNTDIHEFLKRVVRKFCINILRMELHNPDMRDVSKVIYALDMLTAELEQMQTRHSDEDIHSDDDDEDEDENEDEDADEDEDEDEAVDETINEVVDEAINEAVDEDEDENEDQDEAEDEDVDEEVNQINVNEGAQSDEEIANNVANNDDAAKTETISDDSIDYTSAMMQK